MQVSSPAFDQGGQIPRKYTGDGDDVSPVLEWRNVPNGTKSFVILCEDPDAPGGTFRHWAVWDVPPEWRRVNEAMPTQGVQVHQAVNDFGRAGYAGPLPPKGDRAHHYHFKVVALNREHLPLHEEAKVEEVVEVARQYSIDEAELVGVYRR